MKFKQDFVVSVQSLCFSQDSISVTFKRPRDEERIDDAVDLINEGYLSPRAFPNMRVVEFQGRLWSLDNRRLWVFKKARVPSITVTPVGCKFHDGFESLLTTSPKLYAKLSSPGFFPRPRGYCKEFFTDVHTDPAELPTSLSPPPTTHARGGRRQVEVEPTRMSKQSIHSGAPPYVREPDRPPKRRKSPPPFNVTKVSNSNSKHWFFYDDYYHAPPDFRSQQYDNQYHDPYQLRSQHPDLEQQTPRMRGSVVPPRSPRKYSPDRPPFLNTKKRHHGSEHDRHHSPRSRQEACFPRPSKKQRAPSQVSELKSFSPHQTRTAFQECPPHPARKSTKNPARVRETSKASSPPLSRRLHQESERPPHHRKGLNASVPKPPVPTPRDRPRAAPRVRLAKEARPPSPARTRSSQRRVADRPGNVPSVRNPDRKAYDSNGQQPSRQKPLDQRQSARPSVSTDIYPQRRREAKSSTFAAAAPDKPSSPPASAAKRGRASRATSNPKNFSYGFHTSRKRARASRGSKKAGAPTPSTECLSTQLPAHVPDVSVPSSASPKTHRASTEKPSQPRASSSTNANLSTATMKRQIMDDNFTSDVIDPNGNQGQHEPESGVMSPTTKTRQEEEQEQEQEAPEIVDFAARGEFLSDTANILFKLDVKQATPADPELPPLIIKDPKDRQVTLDPKDVQVLDEILQQFQKGEKSAAPQTVHTKPTENTLLKEPSVEAESLNNLPSRTRPIAVHQSAADLGATVTAGLEPTNVQASTPVKDVLELQTGAKAGRAINQQQEQRALSRRKGFLETARTTNSEINPGVTKTTRVNANPIFANEVPEVSKRITRGQLKKEKAMERRKERETRRALREAEKKKEREANSVHMKEKSVTPSKNLTTAIVPYDAARSKEMSKTVQTGDMAYVKVIGELPTIGVEGRRRQHPYLRFLGPFIVKRKDFSVLTNDVVVQYNAYTALVELPDDCCLKRAFSVKVLTKSRSPVQTYLPDHRLSITLVPETVLNKRVARRLRKRKVIHYLVKWKTLPATEATWEPETIFDEHPHLLDQADSPSLCNPYLLRNWKA